MIVGHAIMTDAGAPVFLPSSGAPAVHFFLTAFSRHGLFAVELAGPYDSS